MVETLGVAQAKQRLQEVLSRSLNPRIIDLDITEHELRYRAPTSGHLMGYQDAPTSVETRLAFVQIGRIDVHASYVVFIRDAVGNYLAHLAFATEQDAKIFADCVISFRSYRLRYESGKH